MKLVYAAHAVTFACLWSTRAHALPQIDEVPWSADCLGVPTAHCRFIAEGTPGNELFRVFVNTDGTLGEPTDAIYPDALCNDGTSAVYYVRAGDAVDADRWVVQLHGAGACDTWSRCVDRWCGNGKNYTAEWMSSDESFETILGGGIFLDEPDLNRFATWNHVFVHYCTSDQWVGRKTVAFYGDDPVQHFEVPYHGADVLDAVIAELKARPKKLRDLGMPSLDDASLVLLGGSTSGATGVAYNADRIAEELRLTNPSVDVRAVYDSNFYPAADTVSSGGPYSGIVDPQMEVHYVDWGKSFEVYASEVDASCLAVHGGTEDEWWCGERMHLLTHHSTIPFFVHTDLMDPENPMCGVAHEDLTGVFEDCQGVMVDQLLALDDIASDAIPREGPAEYDPGAPLPGYHAPRCGFTSHAAFGTSGDEQGFFEIKLPTDETATEWLSFHDALWNWVTDSGGPTRVYRDPNDATACPKPPPNVPIGLEATYEAHIDAVLLTWRRGTYDRRYTVYWSTADDLDEDSDVLEVTTDTWASLIGVEHPLLCFAVRAENPVGVSPLTSARCMDFDLDDDGVLDSEDDCNRGDDATDEDADGVPDACDTCIGDCDSDDALGPDENEPRAAICGCVPQGAPPAGMLALLAVPWWRRRR